MYIIHLISCVSAIGDLRHEEPYGCHGFFILLPPDGWVPPGSRNLWGVHGQIPWGQRSEVSSYIECRGNVWLSAVEAAKVQHEQILDVDSLWKAKSSLSLLPNIEQWLTAFTLRSNVRIVCSAVWKMDRPCEGLETYRPGRQNNVHHIWRNGSGKSRFKVALKFLFNKHTVS